MIRRAWLYPLLGLAIGLGLAALIATMVLSRGRSARDDAEPFARAVDLSPLDSAAVYHEGRLKSFDSFAHELVGIIGGPKAVGGHRADFAYLDLMMRPEVYEDRPTIHVKNKPMRRQLATALVSAGEADEAWAMGFVRSGLIEPSRLRGASAQRQLSLWSADLVKTAKHAEALRSALELLDPRTLARALAVVPPASGRRDEAWVALGELWSPGLGAIGGDGASQRVDSALAARLRDAWTRAHQAWTRGQEADAPAASAAIAEFASLLPSAAPSIYPARERLLLESWYFKAGHLTWGWLVYLVSAVLLLMSVVYRWERARLVGMGVFAAAFGLHTVALVWRWYVSGRWPNSNMFEAVTTSVWLGTVLAIGLEVWARRTALRNVFALCGAAASMCALMAAHFSPKLTPSINNMMPILHDIWLYIHTNVIIASYALIAMAAVTGLLYLGVRIAGAPAAYARVGGAGTLMDAGGSSSRAGTRGRAALAETFDGATMVLMELSFVMLWAGLVMGAIWADHSWGRPWGWDPKEVFALNTFLVFLILVHVRLKARDKGLWTALLAVAGCAVMLFNWIVINFVISGLHSYA